MKLTVALVVLATIPFFAFSQSGCDGIRYKTPVFLNTTMTSGVQFGQSTTIGGNTQNLLMDIYEPTGDNLPARPVFIVAHGGGFIQGNRTEMGTVCEYYAHMGYVTATIDYRLIDAIVIDSIGIGDAIYKATSDMKAAIRFFREDAANANLYKIDTNNIFVGGVSAGAIVASMAGYLDSDDNVPSHIQAFIDSNGGLQGNSSTNTQYPSSIHGVVNYSGAILRDHWIDANDPPLFSAHEEFDDVVPCGYGSSSTVPFEAPSYGSCSMHPIADAIGVPNIFYFVPASTAHVGYLSGGSTAVLEQTASFMEAIICGNPIVSVEENTLAQGVTISPNPAVDRIEVTLAEGSVSEIYLTDLSGKKVAGYDLIISENVVTLDGVTVVPGIYLLHLSDGNHRMTKKVEFTTH